MKPTLAIGTSHGKVMFWDATTQTMLSRIFSLPSKQSVVSLLWNKHGHLLVAPDTSELSLWHWHHQDDDVWMLPGQLAGRPTNLQYVRARAYEVTVPQHIAVRLSPSRFVNLTERVFIFICD
jgi:hypothetical protein